MHRVQFTNYCMLAPVVACVQTRAELVVWGRSPQWREGNGSGGGGLHSDEGTRLCWCLERGGNSGYIWYIDLVTQIAVGCLHGGSRLPKKFEAHSGRFLCS